MEMVLSLHGLKICMEMVLSLRENESCMFECPSRECCLCKGMCLTMIFHGDELCPSRWVCMDF